MPHQSWPVGEKGEMGELRPKQYKNENKEKVQKDIYIIHSGKDKE